jgi:flagellin-like protein
MFRQRKGITPVIAIVLLLLVTVGAVGVVYTQFQSITEQGDTQFDTTARSIDVGITSITNNSDGDMELTITNNQDSVTFNTTRFLDLQFYPDQGTPDQAVQHTALPIQNIQNSTTAGDTCFSNAADAELLDPGDSFSCDTNVEYPSASEYIGLVVTVQGGANTWSEECSPRTTTSATC